MSILDLFANATADIKDFMAYVTFPIPGINYLTSHRREHIIYSANANNPRSYVKLKASTKQGLKPIATRVKQAINRNGISTVPIENYSTRGFLKWYRQRAEMKLAGSINIRAIDTRTLVDFLESVEREIL